MDDEGLDCCVLTDEELAEIAQRYVTAIKQLYDDTIPSPDDLADVPAYRASTAEQLCTDAWRIAESLAASNPGDAVKAILGHNDLAGLILVLGLLVNEAANARTWSDLQREVWDEQQIVVPECLATIGRANAVTRR